MGRTYRFFFRPFAEIKWFLPHFLTVRSLLLGCAETDSNISRDIRSFSFSLLCSPLIAALLATLPVNAGCFLLISASEILSTVAAPGSDAQVVANGYEAIGCVLRHGLVAVISEWFDLYCR